MTIPPPTARERFNKARSYLLKLYSEHTRESTVEFMLITLCHDRLGKRRARLHMTKRGLNARRDEALCKQERLHHITLAGYSSARRTIINRIQRDCA